METKMLKSFIIVFLMLFLVLTPVIAEEEPLDIDIEFPAFYEVNISGAIAKNIGVAGLEYPVTVYVSSAGKEVNLTNRYLEVLFTYKGSAPQNRSIFLYNENYIEDVTLSDTFSLSKELKNRECGCFQFNIGFLETGGYVIEWREILGNEEMEEGKSMFISITGPMEYENLLKQAQLLDAQKKSVEASEETTKHTQWMAIATVVLAFFTLVMVLISFFSFRQIRKDREIDLLRKRLGNLYSMLNFHTDIFNKDLSKRDDPDYKSWMNFYKKFRENLYLGSDYLVEKAKHFLEEYVNSNEVRVYATENKQFKEDTEKLISQINSDYEKYLNRLMELTKKPKSPWDIFFNWKKQ